MSEMSREPHVTLRGPLLLLFESFLAGCLASIATQYATHVPQDWHGVESFWHYFTREGIVYLWWSILPFYATQLPVLAASLSSEWYLLGKLDVAQPAGRAILGVTGAVSSVFPIAAIAAVDRASYGVSVSHRDWNWIAVFLGAGAWAGARTGYRYGRSAARASS